MCDNLSNYTPEDLDNIVSGLYKDLLWQKKTEIKPSAFILGGQPGSGKSIMSREISKKFGGNIIMINGDDYRHEHPNYEALSVKYGQDAVLHTQKLAGAVTERLIEELSDKRYNLIIEGTLRTSEVPLKTQALLKNKGYITELSVIAVKPVLSYISTILRYELSLDKNGYARATPKDHHDLVVNNIVDNLNEIYNLKKFDNITIYDRNATCLFDKSNNDLQKPGLILQGVFSDRWKTTEIENLHECVKQIFQFKEKRESSDLSSFKKEIKELMIAVNNNKEKNSILKKLNRSEER